MAISDENYRPQSMPKDNELRGVSDPSVIEEVTIVQPFELDPSFSDGSKDFRPMEVSSEDLHRRELEVPKGSTAAALAEFSEKQIQPEIPFEANQEKNVPPPAAKVSGPPKGQKPG